MSRSALDLYLTGELQRPYLRALYAICLIAGIACSAAYAYLIFGVPELFGPDHAALILQAVIAVFWCCGLASEIPDLAGFFLRRERKAPLGQSSPGRLIVRFISRGENTQVLIESVRESRERLAQAANYAYTLQVVTDLPVSRHFASEERELVEFIVVPAEFRCRNGSLYKARALEYARLHAPRPEESNQTWIVFLDEESKLTVSAVTALGEFMSSDQRRDKIGQGLITYTGGRFLSSYFITAADVQRVGYDLGRFRLQFAKLGGVFFGFHGSYFAASQELIDRVGFDFGPKASITEDIYFAVFAAMRGAKFAWLNGVVREQSPETLRDFFRQRRRWLTGLGYFVSDRRIPFLRRLPILFSVVVSKLHWIVPAVALPLTIFYFAHDFRVPMWGLMAYVASLRASYFIGNFFTVLDLTGKRVRTRLKYFLGFLLIAPVVPILECSASLVALLVPVKAFPVVRKSAVKLYETQPQY